MGEKEVALLKKIRTIEQVCQWKKELWSRVRENIIIKSFKKYNIIYEEGNNNDEEEEESLDDDFQGF